MGNLVSRVEFNRHTIVFDKYAQGTLQIPDVTKVLAEPDLLALYMSPAVDALTKQIEIDFVSLYLQFTSNAPIGSPGTALTEADIATAETVLRDARVPEGSPRYLVVDSETYGSLRSLETFREYHSTGNGYVPISGPVGRVGGMYVVPSPFTPKTREPTTIMTHNLAFARGAIGFSVRPLPIPPSTSGTVCTYAEVNDFWLRVTMDYQPNTLSQQVTIGVLYGVSVLEEHWGVRVVS